MRWIVIARVTAQFGDIERVISLHTLTFSSQESATTAIEWLQKSPNVQCTVVGEEQS